MFLIPWIDGVLGGAALYSLFILPHTRLHIFVHTGGWWWHVVLASEQELQIIESSNRMSKLWVGVSRKHLTSSPVLKHSQLSGR